MYIPKIKDRKEAGFLLSEKLIKYKNTNSVVLAVPRGGVPVGFEIARRLNLPLDIVVSKKIGHPYNKEFAIGAVSMDESIIDKDTAIPKDYLDKEIRRIRNSLKEKYSLYMGTRTPIDIEGKNIIIVDDGIATGHTVLASIAMLRKKKPLKIIVAVPVLPENVLETFIKKTDEFVYLIASDYFRGVGSFYDEFNQVEDKEVIQMLEAACTIEKKVQ